MASTKFYRNRWFQVAVSVVILAVLARSLDATALIDFIKRGDPWLLLLLVLFFPVDRVFMAWKWRLLVRSEGFDLRLWTAIRIYLASSAVGLIVPLGGVGPDVVRVAMLSHHGMPMQLSVPSILVERVCGILGSGIMLSVAVGLLILLLGAQATSSFVDTVWMAAWMLVTLGAGIGACYFLFRVPHVGRMLGKLIGRLGLRGQFQTLRSYTSKGGLLGLSVFLAWVEQWAAIIAFFIACKAFGVPLTLLQAAAIVPFASILERLPISLGGFGMREAGIVMVSGLFGIATSDALLLSLANYSMYLLATVPMATVYFLERKSERER